ncbi:imidazole glycerol phosphate synthase, glutamine amidotransferase subunit [Rubrobacter radiotolerans]|uniref:Imidazole glycerol phosphate synthase subunit HisH n=1 Tax=Rubrobacter radiotolerans TaxID=42256 RepID=A0A023X1Z8_RUBRA|nr:imidazole glycerol phosphate synthase subunit HisH [Rubrobacter radiotolerans]AHY46378.1 imidazole glycerol phosphate synthase, glutamine amidotransferase subunit [Rubrobacter radiotolerans]MDX5893785.1 imidazole glycerol phosphate synthase subunit HisH [Rubrobacter radiotolerans]SMC04500.1 glutamine amidotransferase [Rubrobacter radiotolerans DSM 5868]
MKVAVVDYDAGNTLSVTKALRKVGADVELTYDTERILASDAVVLPGVGAFGDCMDGIRARGLDAAVRDAVTAGKPFLGVCVGLQVLFDGSEETPEVPGLGILPGKVVRFDVAEEGLKVPHMGWNQLRVEREHPVLEGLGGEAFYFVHSYYPEPEPDDLLATSEYGGRFCAVAGRDNVVATQFHPEKSSAAGLRLYRSFLDWSGRL